MNFNLISKDNQTWGSPKKSAAKILQFFLKNCSQISAEKTTPQIISCTHPLDDCMSLKFVKYNLVIHFGYFIDLKTEILAPGGVI